MAAAPHVARRIQPAGSTTLWGQSVAEQERKDRILVIDGVDDERELLVESTLPSFGYSVQFATDGGTGLSMALEESPDVIILDTHLEGLSGQDIMAALNAQSVNVPVIAIAKRGSEKDLLDVFRLGAKDYVVRPIREAEIVQAVERALKEVRMQRERDSLVGEVRRAAEEAQAHLRELKALMGIGRSITAIGQPREVFERIMRAAIQLTRAESAGLFAVNPDTNQMIVETGHNMSRNLIERIGQPISDDLASLVMSSHEAYLGTGKGLEQFKPAHQGAASVIYAPMVFGDKPIGVLWVANTRLPFDPHMKDLTSALADYGAIAVFNSRLYMSMQERTSELEQINEHLHSQQVAQSASAPASAHASGDAVGVLQEIRRPLTELLGNMNLFRTGEMGPIGAGQQAAVDVMHRKLEALVNKVDQLIPPTEA